MNFNIIKKIINKKVVAAILLFVIAFIFLSRESYKIEEISIIDDGFIPLSINITTGDTIRFVNKSSGAHWPASDPHPLHDNYRGFDAGRALLPLSSWEFTFLNAGVWSYHDHLFPHIRGVISVSEKKSFALLWPFGTILNFAEKIFNHNNFGKKNDEVLQEISKIVSEKNKAVQIDLVRSLAEKYGPKEALSYLKTSGLPFTGETHLLVHTIGNVAYKQYGLQALRYCDESFLSACYHGVILNAIAEGGLTRVSKMIDQCKVGGTLVFTQCSHAAGHGFLAHEDYKVLFAVGLCDTLGELNQDIPLFNCYDGVFMENIFGVHKGQPSPNRMVKFDDPFYPCNSVPKKYQSGCWANQATLMYQLFNGDLRKVAEHCDRVKDSEYKKICYDNFSRQIHPLTLGKTDQAITLCKNATDQWQNFCLFTVMEAAFSVGDTTAMPYEICAHLEGDAKQTCYERLFNLMVFHKNAGSITGDYCNYVREDKWRDACAEKLGVSVSDVSVSAGAGSSDKKEIEQIKTIAKRDGIVVAYAYLQEKDRNNSLANAHDLAHLIGRIAYEELGEQGLEFCTSDFAFGCYHGFFEELIQQKGEKAIESAVRGCAALSLRGRIASCIHGIGHGILAWKNNIGAALAVCDTLTSEEQLYCFDGVFMEYYTGVMNKRRSVEVSRDDPWDICLNLSLRYQTQCIRNRTLSLLYSGAADDHQWIIQNCEKIKNDSNLEQCVNATGLFASQQSEGNTGVVRDICNLFRASTHVALCTIASAREFIFQGKYSAEGPRLCKELSTIWRPQCFNSLQEMHMLYGR